MKNLFKTDCLSLLLVTFCLCLTISCNKQNKKEILLPVQKTEGGAWSFINSKGEPVGTQEWEFEPSLSIDGIFTVRQDDGLCVYRWEGKEARPIDSLQNLVSVGIYNDGLLPVTPPMQRIRIVDNKGNVKFTLDPIDGQEINSCADMFSENLLIVTTIDGKTGVINNKGEVVVKPTYSDISNFNSGYALAANYDYDNYEKGPSYFILDKTGKATPVKGEFAYEEGDGGGYLPEFVDGAVYVPGKSESDGSEGEDSEEYEYNSTICKITTDGKVTVEKQYTWTTMLPDGGKITSTYVDDKSVEEWFDKDGKLLKKIDQSNQYLNSYGNYVVLQQGDTLTLYDDKGTQLNTLKGYNAVWSEGDFGMVVSVHKEDYSLPSEYKILDAAGQLIPDGLYYGIGLAQMISLKETEHEDNDFGVMSAYVDVTAAATKLASMLTEGVKGKEYYYLGQSVASVLSAGNNARYYSGASRTFSIPTDTTYYLANGSGFWIGGTAESSEEIVSPTYKQYFQVDHYDYWGRPWGYNRTKQVGVHFNKSAKIMAFDLQLHTNYPSGTRIREAVVRRLKNEGYTITKETDNYDELSNGYNSIIIYGNKDTNGVGAIVYSKDGWFYKSDDDKAALPATLT